MIVTIYSAFTLGDTNADTPTVTDDTLCCRCQFCLYAACGYTTKRYRLHKRDTQNKGHGNTVYLFLNLAN